MVKQRYSFSLISKTLLLTSTSALMLFCSAYKYVQKVIGALSDMRGISRVIDEKYDFLQNFIKNISTDMCFRGRHRVTAGNF